MARTKAKARRGPDGHAFRENAEEKKAAEHGSGSAISGIGNGNVSGSGNGKRKRNRERDGAGMDRKGQAESAPENTAKRRKGSGDDDVVEESLLVAAGDGVSAAQDTDDAPSDPRPKSAPEASLLVPIFPGLETTHTVTTMSIISSSNINKKVSRILELLSEKPSGGEGKKHAVVMLYAKAPVVSKVVSVAEIVKREIAREGGKWFSYCVVQEVMGERKERAKEKVIRTDKATRASGKEELAENSNEDEGQEGEEDEEEAFEVMKTPFERALEVEGKPKVRAMPVLSLYLSRIRIETLRMKYGEQTNAQDVE
ncbi:hypothetical protein ONS95_003144 [Cadophora gregata]|uniref:uncharacterized protein n=1 Tax=Cadophora gregata TaxID=51156 RepID=UPI0026DC6706|nr:uncharacterized protein ONS95_003144 [Cadophora gregata]KAK0108329.1 hypothetical protein ONS95_003144 [Cadophora gregata]KAK0109080.1 hypothetical protein ONS96_002909 [Cadophora gregata f. sp. sojae]